MTCPLKLAVSYTPEDKRVRDITGLLDGILHVLERAGIVKNDGLVIGLSWWPEPVNKQKAGVVCQLYEYSG
jgi:hypothetical protein